MAKLGYTFYPKDWGNSESVFELNLSERGLYRELIDLAMLNDNKTEIKLDVWCRKFAIDIDGLKSILGKLSILNLIQINKDILFIPSCESRLKLVRGGSNGGKKSKPITKPIVKPTPKPIAKQIEKEIETKKEIESEDEKEADEIFDIDAELFVYKSKFFQNYDILDFDVEFKKLENEISNSENENQKLFSSQCLNFLREEQRKKVSLKKEKHQQIIDELKNSTEWLDIMASQNKVSPEKIKLLLNEFKTHLFTGDKNHQSKTEFLAHFKSWIPKKKIETPSTQTHNR